MIKVYGTKTCDDCIRTKKLFADYNVPYEFIDIAISEEATKFVEDANKGAFQTPVLVLENGEILIEPSNQVLIEKLRLKK